MGGELPSRSRPEPLYQQVVGYLKQRLADGTYPPSSAMPSEMELMSLLGVSRPTVRHALQLLIAEGLIERIPGRGTFARAPERRANNRHSGTVGLLVPEMRDYFMMRIVNGAEHTMAQRDYHPLLASSGNEIGLEQRHLREMWEGGKVDGFLVMAADSPQPHRTLSELAAAGVPVVLVDRYFDELDVPFVVSDDVRGGYLLTRHLLQLGHRRIGFVTRPNLYVSSVAGRLRGYRQALEEAGLPFDQNLVFQGLLPFLSEVQVLDDMVPRLALFERQAIREFLSRADRPSAILACNDIIAVQVMETCREMGLAIPGDVALVGYADEPVASALTPPLTTVRQRPYDMGARAAAKLLEMLDGRQPERETFLPVELVVRASCGATS
ncbi:MAG: GntR family transcriptional regulator [Anaerolineae bacterium]|nr:GntR family transcriptional regulator [Anaerolineae bacterium]